AQAVLDRARTAERVLKDQSGLTVGNLEIAASQTIANYWLPRRLADFHDAHPGIKLNVTIGNTRQVETAVVNGTVDIGFVEGATRSQELIIDTVDQDRMALVVSAKRWPDQWNSEHPPELLALPWVVREPGSGTRAVLEDLIAASGAAWEDLSIVLELPSNEAVRVAIEAGVGAALISRHVVAPGIAAGILREVDIEIAPRGYRMLRHRQRNSTAAGRALTEMLLQAGDGAAVTSRMSD
ncbi:MAG: LysR substrate-binding domain-containing protein, partial [Proteobacteria bacterium]|nr:LysR substrate-binding domain-containing protein [Pseudomonadota bacterium]